MYDVTRNALAFLPKVLNNTTTWGDVLNYVGCYAIRWVSKRSTFLRRRQEEISRLTSRLSIFLTRLNALIAESKKSSYPLGTRVLLVGLLPAVFTISRYVVLSA